MSVNASDQVRKMSSLQRTRGPWLLFCLAALLLPVLAHPQSQDPTPAQDPNPAEESSPASELVRLTIVVTGGSEKKPVENASVYVRYVRDRKLAKDKKIEMNLKTNQSGVCHSPRIPAGKLMVQVVAPGWKTFGQYYDVDEAEYTVNINLVPPRKWY